MDLPYYCVRVATVLRAILIAVVLTVLPVAAGVWVAGDGEPEPPRETPYTSTPLADFDTLTVPVARTGFCDLVASEAVTEALDVEATSEVEGDAWTNGDVRQIGRVRDRVHEYGCAYDDPAGSSASAWVLAPPVALARARELGTAARGERGCTAMDAPPAFGTASVALVCEGKRQTVASYRGLFGDAWLTCALALPPGADADREEQIDRTGRWCVAVAQAASVQYGGAS